MFEELKNKINLYFTKLDKQLLCFSFNINERSVVEARKDSVVKLYDYYRPEYEVLQLYRINENCRFNHSNQLPKIADKSPTTKIKLNNVTIELSESNDETTEASQEKTDENTVKRDADYLNTGDQNTSYKDIISNNKKKRDVYNQTTKRKPEGIRNGENTHLNKDFVDMDIDMDFSDCNGNVPYYTTSDNSTRTRN